MIKIAQYGEGNFLRSFVDLYFETLNNTGGNYSVNVIQPIPSPELLAKFNKQKNKYNVVLRGIQEGKTVEDVYPVNVIDKFISPFCDIDSYYALACDPNLKIIISNTTEAGICFNCNDDFDDFDKITYPAKLTKFLYKRFISKLDGVYILPVELIDKNADELYNCVNQYIRLWNLPNEFKTWNDNENYFCNTLVDRIVSGYPRDEKTKAHLADLIGKNDELMSVGEPFGLWAVEKKGNIEDFIKEGFYNINVVLTNDIDYYKKRKVRILNGSHTNMVPVGLVLNHETVYDCMVDKKMYNFFSETLKEMTPFVSSDIKMTKIFAHNIEERFFNPFLNHQLTSIALNSISKWKARVLPSFKDYYAANNKIPPNITLGFAYLMYIYKTKYAELNDDKAYLDFFATNGNIKDFMSDISIWGEDLTRFDGFYFTVVQYINRIESGEILI